MNKHIEKLKKQLFDISEVVNSFKSEAVQVKIVERLLDAIIESDKSDNENSEAFNKKEYKLRLNVGNRNPGRGLKKTGATKILNKILLTGFFDTSRSIASIANFCKENHDSDFKTSELSGILLKLVKENKLKRGRSDENNRFDYMKA